MSGESNYPIISGGNLAATINSEAYRIDVYTVFSIQVVWSGTSVTGSLKLQASNDIGGFGDQAITGVTNWTDVPNTTQAVSTDADSHLWNVVGAAWRFVRVVYEPTTGTGVMNGRIQVKSSEVT